MTNLRTPRKKTIVTVIVCLLIVIGISLATFAILATLKPNIPGITPPIQNSDDSANSQPLTPTDNRTKAEDLLKDNKLNEAKAAYQKAADGYTEAGNLAAAADANKQIAIINAQLEAISQQEPAVQQSDKPLSSGSN